MQKFYVVGFGVVIVFGVLVFGAPQVFAATSTVSSVAPAFGPAAGGTAVTITGTNFSTPSATAVNFGGVAATAFTIISNTSIIATSSAGSGIVDVTVVNASGTSATSSADQFTYKPTVSSISPTAGSAAGGTAVTITGTGFSPTSTVSFGGTLASSTFVSSSSISATSTAGSGKVDITVANGTSTSATSSVDQFTYISAGAGPATVNLLSAGNFVILAETAITEAVPSSGAIVGNIGLSPATGAGIHVTCAEMTGTIYEVDAAYTGGGGGSTTCAAPGTAGSGANKTLVDNAVGDMLTAYNAAAAMTGSTTSTTELGAGNISGMTLPTGVYKWSTDVNINSNVYLSGSASDVWVFQIAGNLNVAAGSTSTAPRVVLQGGALAKNVFWQVGGGTGATLGTYSTLNGTILSATQVVLNTGSILNGRALAQTQVVLQGNQVSIPTGVTTFPVITTVSPTSGPTTGGTSVTITGVGFTSASAVNFGANSATAFTVNSDTSITAISPARFAGTVDITVTAPGGTSGTGAADQFRYDSRGGESTAQTAVTQTVDNANPVEGATIHYTITVSAQGPSMSYGVVASDTLPSGLTLVSAAILAGSYNSFTGSWNIGTLNNGASATLILTATVNSGTAGNTITNNASVMESSDENNPLAAPNFSSVSINVGSTNSSGGSTSGGGGGSVPPPPALPAAPTASQLQLNSLMATLQSLIAQANQRGLSTGLTGKFSVNLQFGSNAKDVKSLQLFLIKQNGGPSARALAIAGANGHFGPLTMKALIEFQKSVGIVPASGFFGPKTRAYINSLGQ